MDLILHERAISHGSLHRSTSDDIVTSYKFYLPFDIIYYTVCISSYSLSYNFFSGYEI